MKEKIGFNILEYELPEYIKQEKILEYYKEYLKGKTEYANKILYYNLKLIKKMIGKYYIEYGYEPDEVFNIIYSELLENLNKYNPERSSFSTFMYIYAKRAILAHIYQIKEDSDMKTQIKALEFEENNISEKSDKYARYNRFEDHVISELYLRKLIENTNLNEKDLYVLLSYYGALGYRLKTVMELKEEFNVSDKMIYSRIKRAKKQIRESNNISI